MSHFTVLVIGEDVEGQLEPYDENISVAPYRKYEKDPEWLFRFYEKNEGHQRPSLEDLLAWINKRWGDDERPYGIDEMGVYQLSTYNPDSKWDWYTIGGRWMGFFKLKAEAMDRATAARLGQPGTFGNEPVNDADQCLRGDIDAEAMRSIAGERAGKLWDKAEVVGEGTAEPETWATMLARYPQDIDRARREYREQERIEAVHKHDELCRKEERWDDALLGFFGDFDVYLVSRELFVERARNNAICPYAYLKDGEWFAPGEMGWFGMSTENEDDSARFARQFNELFDALPDDTLVTMVDCHI